MRDKNTVKRSSRLRRHRRIRNKLFGTEEKPRLCIYRSLNHIYAQIIDDVEGKTLASASSLKIELPPASAGGSDDEEKKGEKSKSRPDSAKMRRSKAVGREIAEKARKQGIEEVAFDRGGFLYHGRIAALADEARKNGLKF